MTRRNIYSHMHENPFEEKYQDIPLMLGSPWEYLNHSLFLLPKKVAEISKTRKQQTAEVQNHKIDKETKETT